VKKKYDKTRIQEAVRTAELKSSGEFVTVIAKKSDSYNYIALFWSAIIALTAPPAVYFFFPALDFHFIYLIQVAAFLVANILFMNTALVIYLIPRDLKHMRARRLAIESFFNQGIHTTKDRAGVLFFVSLAEKYVEIIADKGINEKVSPDIWNKIVDQFIVDVRAGEITRGMVTAIESCSNLLAEHFPRQKNDVNELGDKLIELD